MVYRRTRCRPPAMNQGYLLVGQRHGDGHVVDHAGHAVDVGGELGDEAFFGFVLGRAAQGDHAVRGRDAGVQHAGGMMGQEG